MKILVIHPYVPYPLDRGAYHRAFQLLRALAQEHEVDLIALAERCAGAEHKPVFAEFCRSVEIIPFEHPAWQKLIPKRLLNPLPSTIAHWTIPQLALRLDRALQQTEYNAVHICDIVLGQFLLQRPQPPLVVDRTRVDLQYQLMEGRRMRLGFRSRILGWENIVKLWIYERAIARRSALQVVCGPDDEQFVRRYVDSQVPIAVIPNGVDLDYFHPDAAPSHVRAEQPTILFCGAMDYNPNIDALRWYFEAIHPALQSRVPGLHVLIVGKDPVPEVRQLAARPGVTVTGGVPDVRPYYRTAWLQIVPLRIGGGTRLKIVESLGMRTPVVSTRIGAQGLPLVHEHDILLADTAEAFASETARALNDPNLRRRLAENGLATARQHLAWPSLGRQLCQAYSRIA